MIRSVVTDFLESMAAGVVLVTKVEDGVVVGTAIHSLASYSINPPSVMFGVTPQFANCMVGEFGVSILSRDQARIEEKLSDAPGAIDPGELSASHPLCLEGALAQLSCQVTFNEAVGGAALVVGEVSALTVAGGVPLVSPRRAG